MHRTQTLINKGSSYRCIKDILVYKTSIEKISYIGSTGYFILRTFLSTSYADLNSISYLFILLVWASTAFYTCVDLVQHLKIPETLHLLYLTI